MPTALRMAVVALVALCAGAGAVALAAGGADMTWARILTDAYAARHRDVKAPMAAAHGAIPSEAMFDAGYRWARYMDIDDPQACIRQPPSAFREGCARRVAEDADGPADLTTARRRRTRAPVDEIHSSPKGWLSF
jgi:hypothetical protein